MKEEIKLLPKIEVSFQDDFSGSEREVTLTPKYVLQKMLEKGLNPKIGDKILLFEKDGDGEGGFNYLCNIGEIIVATNDVLKNNYDLKILDDKLVKLNDKPFVVKIEGDDYFNLPIDSF